MEIFMQWAVPIIMTIMMSPMMALFFAGFIALFRQIAWVPLVRPRLLEQAEREGRVLRATLVDSQLVRTRNGGYYQNTYEYNYNGVSMKYTKIKNLFTVYDQNDAQPELFLYYQKKPEHACEPQNLGSGDWKFGKIFLITLLLCATGIFCFIKFYLVGQFF